MTPATAMTSVERRDSQRSCAYAAALGRGTIVVRPSDQNQVATGKAVRRSPSQGNIALAAALAVFVLAWGCFIFDLVVPIYPRNFDTLPISVRAILVTAAVANVVPLVLSIRAVAARRGFQSGLIALVISSVGVVFCVTAILL